MSDPLSSVRRGEPLVFTASGENAKREAARAHRSRQFDVGSPSRPVQRGGDVVLVKNHSGAPVERFGVLAIVDPLIEPAANEDSFSNQRCFSGVAPTSETRNFVVLQEPLGVTEIGYGMIAGLTPALLQLDTDLPGPRYVGLSEALGTGALTPLESSPCEVLWRESGSGLLWALVRMGHAPAAPAPVLLTQTGGSQGTASGAATWRYRVSTIDGFELATNVNPTTSPHHWKRPSIGQMSPATFGYAHRNGDNALSLGWINETPVQEAC